MNRQRLTRSDNRVVAGVCAGIAEYMGWDINMVKILYLIISIFSAAFPGILVYIILRIVMQPAIPITYDNTLASN